MEPAGYLESRVKVTAKCPMALIERLADYDNPQSIGSRLRRKRAAPLFEMISVVAAAKGTCTIIDIGGANEYSSAIGALDLLREKKCRVLLVNSNEASLSGISDSSIFDTAVADGCLLDYADRSFDIAHSNSVIEHVGSWQRMMEFAIEIRRIGCGYFIQTPNFWFPLEPHFNCLFFHFLPEPMRVALLTRLSLGWSPRRADIGDAVAAVQSCHLLDMKMFRALFPDAEIVRERIFGLTKSLIAIRGPTHIEQRVP